MISVVVASLDPTSFEQYEWFIAGEGEATVAVHRIGGVDPRWGDVRPGSTGRRRARRGSQGVYAATHVSIVFAIRDA